MPVLKAVYFRKYLFFRRELREAKFPKLFFLKIMKLVFLRVLLLIEYTFPGKRLICGVAIPR